MALTHRMKVGDHKPSLSLVIQNDAGIVNLTLASDVRLLAYDYEGVEQWNLLLTVTSPLTGTVTYEFDEITDAALTADPLRLRARVVVTWVDGEQQTFPVFGWFRIIIEPQEQPVLL